MLYNILVTLKPSTCYENKFQGTGIYHITCRSGVRNIWGKRAETLKYVICTQNANYKFFQHLLENGHAFGKMDDVKKIM